MERLQYVEWKMILMYAYAVGRVHRRIPRVDLQSLWKSKNDCFGFDCRDCQQTQQNKEDDKKHEPVERCGYKNQNGQEIDREGEWAKIQDSIHNDVSCQILPCKGDYRGACYWHIILFSSTHVLEQLLNVLHKGSSLLRRPQETQHTTFLDGFASADAKDRGKVLPRIPSLSLQNLKHSVWRALGTMLDTTFHTLHGTIWENTTLRFQRLSGFTHSAKMTIQSSIKSWTNSEVFLSSDARQSMWSASTYICCLVCQQDVESCTLLQPTVFNHWAVDHFHLKAGRGQASPACRTIIECVGVQVGHVLPVEQSYWRSIVVFNWLAMHAVHEKWQVYVSLDLIRMFPTSLNQMQKSDSKQNEPSILEAVSPFSFSFDECSKT